MATNPQFDNRRAPQTPGTRRRLPGNDQPLKPRGVNWPAWLGVGLICLLGAGVAIPNRDAIGHYVNRPIEAVKLTTLLNRVNQSEVTGLLAAYMHEGFFDIDVSGVKRQLESHPWVARAEVKRVWPNTMVIALTEETAIARWGEESLLNQSGQIFTPPQLGDAGSLPLLAGPDGSETRMMEQFQAFNQILYASGLRIERLILSERESWQITVSGGLQLVAGRTAVRDRLKRFAAIYDKRIGNDIADIEEIDLRYSNGFTVKKKQHDLSEVAVR